MKKQTAFRIDEGVLKTLSDYAKNENRSLNNYVETILKNYIENERRRTE